MPDDAGLDQVMRQPRHCETGGAADLHGVRVSRANAEMLGEHGCEHDMRRDSRIAAEDAVDLIALQPGIGNRKRSRLAHEVERGRALMPAECRQSDAGDEAHGDMASRKFVIPGCADGRRPATSRFRVRIFDAPRNDGLKFLSIAYTTSASPAPSRQ